MATSSAKPYHLEDDMTSRFSATPLATDQSACYESWRSYYVTESTLWTPYPAQTTTKVFETIESFGDNSTYTECDGIPRFKFNSPPTSTRTRTVSVVSASAGAAHLDHATNEPQCRFDEKFCEAMWDSYTARRLRSADDDFEFYDAGSPMGRIAERCPRPRECYLDMGEEVVLIYWPSNLASRDICASNGYGQAITLAADSNAMTVITTSAITFKGRDLISKYYIKSNITGGDFQSKNSFLGSSVLSGPFTFTSPTVYLAHHPISAREWIMGKHDPFAYQTELLGEVSSVIRTASIIPLSPNDIFSVRLARGSERDGIQFAQLVAKGEFQPNPIEAYSNSGHPKLETVPFDFGHLQNPVPASVYYEARSADCWGIKQTHCGTITDDTYRPKLIIKNKVWASIAPKWYECQRPVLVDPPIALTAVNTLQIPVLSPITRPTPAQAGMSLAQPFSSPTPGSRKSIPRRMSLGLLSLLLALLPLESVR